MAGRSGFTRIRVLIMAIRVLIVVIRVLIMAIRVPIMMQERLLRFYSEHAPEKIANIDLIVRVSARRG